MKKSTHPGNMRKFIKALRSGKYKQGREALRLRGQWYCCLGVACDVSKKGRWQYQKTRKGYKYTCKNNAASTSTLPAPVAEWLGIDSADPILTVPSRFSSVGSNTMQATRVNDQLRAKFAEIADAFERTYL